MEDVLEVYKRPYDPKFPVVCMDEQPMQLIQETKTPIPASPGNVERYDYEYERVGTVNHFMFTEPLGGFRRVSIRDTKTMKDWAEEIKCLVDTDYKDATKIILVCDNLNTHKIASLYVRFPPEEALRISQKLEIHFTPKHGSWLNIAEIELSVLTKQCLNRRIGDAETLRKEITTWYKSRNEKQKNVTWQFTTSDARIKLKRLYPQY